MSKCKAVLDSEKITEIRVKAKAQEVTQEEPESKDVKAPKQTASATQQQSE